MKKLLSLPFCALSLFAWAQNEDSVFIRRIADEILLHGQAYEDLRVLTKQIGGRLSGSPGMVKAEQWGLQTMKELKPDNAWLQECMVPHWVRGGKDVAISHYQGAGASAGKGGTKDLDVLALGNSIGTGTGGVTADVLEVKDFDDLDRKKNEVKGKIVFYNY